jgi:hypothetical protein
MRAANKARRGWRWAWPSQRPPPLGACAASALATRINDARRPPSTAAVLQRPRQVGQITCLSCVPARAYEQYGAPEVYARSPCARLRVIWSILVSWRSHCYTRQSNRIIQLTVMNSFTHVTRRHQTLECSLVSHESTTRRRHLPTISRSPFNPIVHGALQRQRSEASAANA